MVESGALGAAADQWTVALMISLLTSRIETLRDICRKHNVMRLEVFGTAATGQEFDDLRSDVDFLVSFPPGTELGPWLATYFNLRDDLQQALNKPVDLVMAEAATDLFFRRQLEQSRELIYAG